jgi:hypothetical protein
MPDQIYRRCLLSREEARLARFLRGLEQAIKVLSDCFKMEQSMQNPRYYFETKRPAVRKNSVQQTQVLTIRSMIAEVDHLIMALDRSIEIEQERTRVNDRSHYAYPMSARAMETRRNNLKMTRDALAERLSTLADSKPNLVTSAA